ncbi:MAG: S8 family serine peptidase [Chloroflexota bacterium]
MGSLRSKHPVGLRRPRRFTAVAALALILTLITTLVSLADSPYPLPPNGQDPYDYASYLFLGPDDPLPDDFANDDGGWKYTSAQSPDPNINQAEWELYGVMGASVDLAWRKTTGRPDVVLAVLDSGIEWQFSQPDLVNKIYLNRSELPLPEGCADYDCDYNGVFDVRDYAADARVSDLNGNGEIDPEDLIMLWSDGTDADGNGYVDDVAGWDFFEGDNDPLDDVTYGHGTGEGKDSAAEANNGGDVGVCPSCLFMPLRVGDSFVVDVNHWAEAVLFAVDNGASVVQEATGSLNNSRFAQEAVDYGYQRGVPIIASAADEEAEHHNYPSNLEHTIMVNSVTKYVDEGIFTMSPASYLYLNGCTNFGGHTAVTVPSTGCSSEATGKSSGMAALVVSAAKNAYDLGILDSYPGGTGFVLSANEIKQIMTMTADDVDLSGHYQVSIPLVPSRRYPSQPGWDMYFGYGRVNANLMVTAVMSGTIPPEADITGPRWFEIVDPDQGTLAIDGRVAAVRADRYRYTVEVAPGVQPLDNAFRVVYRSPLLTGPYEGTLATVDLAALAARMPYGVEGPLSDPATGRGVPNKFSFTVRVRVTDNFGRLGEDRKSLFLHRDPDLADGAPIFLEGGGEGSPVFADLNGDGRHELLMPTNNGEIHAYQADGTELPGWPAHTDPQPVHASAPAYLSGEITMPIYTPMLLGSPAVGELVPGKGLWVVAADLEGKVYAWDAEGVIRYGFPVQTNRAYADPSVRNENNRLDWAISGAPALGDLNNDGDLEIVAGSFDRHVYAWQEDGSLLPGWPVLVADPTKVESVAPGTHQITFTADSGVLSGTPFLVSPALGDVNGDGWLEVVIGRDEEYQEDPNNSIAPLLIEFLLDLLDESLANGRMYAIWHDGTLHDGDPSDDDGLDADAFLPGWPVKLGFLVPEFLPTVGEGPNGSAALADLDGDGDVEVTALMAAGPAMVFQEDGTGYWGLDPYGNDYGFQGEPPAYGPGTNTQEAITLPGLGAGIFADLGNGLRYAAPAAGLGRLLDVALPADQRTSDDLLGLWDVETRNFVGGFPRQMNDMQFFTTPMAVDLDGDGLAELVAGSAVYDLHAFHEDGSEVADWPKLTGGWVTGVPAAGDWDGDGLVELAVATREGWLFVWEGAGSLCAAAEWPKYNHGLHNDSNYERPTGLCEAR